MSEQGKLFRYVEDAELDQKVADPDDPNLLKDEQLEAGGLRRTGAWVRTRASKNALRVRKNREKKKEQKGVGQVNVETKLEHQEPLKNLAKVSRETGDLVGALRQILLELDPAGSPDLTDAEWQLLRTARSRGLRAWLLRVIAHD